MGKRVFTSGTGRFFLVMMFLCARVFSLPSDYQVINGSADITVDGSTMTINASADTVINFDSFDISAAESVLVYLPSSSDSFLSNVIGGQITNIFGTLECNGFFILVNPAGIFIGPDAGIDSHDLVLSSRTITTENFLAENFLFEKLDDDTAAMIKNMGTITIEDGGFGVLIAANIENHGKIIANAGSITLAAGDAVRLDISGDGLISVAVDSSSAARLTNTGELSALNGTVILDASDIGDIFESAINLEGIVRGQSAQIRTDGTVVITGNVTLDADTTIENMTAELEGTEFYFGSGRTIKFSGDVAVHGGTGYDGLTKFYATTEGQQSYLDFRSAGTIELELIALKDVYNIGEKVKIRPSTNWGNAYNWDLDPLWDNNGGTGDGLWSSAINWDTDTVPTNADIVTLNGSCTDSSTVDAGFAGTIGQLIIDSGYTGTLTLERSLTVTDANGGNGNVTLNDGVFDLNGNDFTMTGTFSNSAVLQLIGDEILSGFVNDTTSGLVRYRDAGGWAQYNGLAAGYNYYDIEFNGDSDQMWLLASDLNISHSLAIADANSYLVTNGNNLTMTGATFSNNGWLLVNGTETFTGFTNDSDSGWIIYQGSGTFNGLCAGYDYYNLGLGGTSVYFLESDLDVNNYVHINNANALLDLNGHGFELTGASLTNTGTLRLRGDEVLTDFVNDTTGGTIEYNGSGSYTSLVAGNSYYNLVFNGTGTWQFDAALNVNNDLTIAQGNVVHNDNTVTVSGTFTDNGIYVESMAALDLILNPPETPVEVPTDVIEESLGDDMLDAGSSIDEMIDVSGGAAGEDVVIDDPVFEETSDAGSSDAASSGAVVIDDILSSDPSESADDPESQSRTQGASLQSGADQGAGDDPSNTEDSFFDFSLLWEEGDTKYSKYYKDGKYKTSVIVYEGRVAVGTYDEKGADYGNKDFVLPGQKRETSMSVSRNVSAKAESSAGDTVKKDHGSRADVKNNDDDGRYGFDMNKLTDRIEDPYEDVYKPAGYRTIVRAVKGSYVVRTYERGSIKEVKLLLEGESSVNNNYVE